MRGAPKDVIVDEAADRTVETLAAAGPQKGAPAAVRFTTTATNNEGSPTMTIYKIVGLLAVLLAIVAAFVNVPYAAPLLAVAGLVIGISIAGEHHVRVIVSALALHMVANTFNGIPGAGASITTILGNFGTLAAGAALLIIVRNMYERLKP